MKTQHVLVAVMLLASFEGVRAVGGVERPDWASQIPIYGVLPAEEKLPGDLPKLAGDSHRLVDQDDAGRIYILQAETREVTVFRPDGRAYDAFTLPAPLDPMNSWLFAFAVDARGERFAILDGGRVHVLSREHGIGTIRLPFLGTDVAFSKGELVVSRAPARVRRGKDLKPVMEEDRDVVLRFGEEGEKLGAVWRSGELEGPSLGQAAMTTQFLLGAGVEGEIWIGRQTGTLELHRVLRGKETDVWKDAAIGTAPSFLESPPKEVEGELQKFTKEARERAAFFDAPITIRDLVVHDGLAWVLLGAGILADAPMVAVFQEGRSTPLAYFVLGGKGVDFASLAVTDDGLWVIPRHGTEPVRYFERISDPVMLQMGQQWDRGHRSTSVPSEPLAMEQPSGP